jgi:hypothetical protein
MVKFSKYRKGKKRVKFRKIKKRKISGKKQKNALWLKGLLD